ncbi:hypothetical protein KSP40_PGU014724 [Platanthera guangdongensis]|uniref:Uncharacterized protein n=1 Tax=Platanthera guangdongensis TaxID=2320717 RepID=A0ABR2MGX8_9ASPA
MNLSSIHFVSTSTSSKSVISSTPGWIFIEKSWRGIGEYPASASEFQECTRPNSRGVLIVLGLGTAFRLALECCHEWGTRHVLGMDVENNTGYHTAV